eukprot:TRINITY_DN250_c0_g2_i2.p2 TRINITY_DN250_c0_g2~~TRINITY_DN250_c0_g2_i2.p2  ORF type:complete len:525 (+),score=165.42 TRINITY_DN250_c0_g2_i2:88-1662(+)
MGGSTPLQGIPVQFARGDDQDAVECRSMKEEGGTEPEECGDDRPLLDGDAAGEPVTGTPLYKDGSTEGRFVIQGYKDIWAAVIFMLTVVAAIVVFTVHAHDGTLWGMQVVKVEGAPQRWAPPPTPAPASSMPRGDPWVWLGTAVGLGLVAGAVMLMVLRAFPRAFIVVGNVMLFAYLCLVAYFCVTIRGGVISFWLVSVALLNVLLLYWARHRIPFASALLSYSSTVVCRYKSTVAVSLVGCAVQVGYIVAVLAAIAPWLVMTVTQVNTADGALYRAHWSSSQPVLVVLFLLFIFWTDQVVLGVIRVTVCGVAATYYFFDEQSMPKHPTCASFRRAITTSLGSICFGGLIVAFLETLRSIVLSTRNRLGGAVACIVDCILRCMAVVMRRFNRWAFAEIAIYGDDFMTAAQRCFRLIFTVDGFEGVLSECLLSRALVLAAIVGGLGMGIGAGLAWNSFMAGLLTGFIVFAICRAISIAPDGVAIALFVCYAEAPEFMQRSHPELYRTFQETIELWKRRHPQRPAH